MKPITVCSYKTQIIGHIVSDFFLQILEVPLPAFKTDRRRFYEWLKEWDLLWKQCVISYKGSQLYKPAVTEFTSCWNNSEQCRLLAAIISRNDGGLFLDNQLIPEWNCWGFFFPSFRLSITYLFALLSVLDSSGRKSVRETEAMFSVWCYLRMCK